MISSSHNTDNHQGVDKIKRYGWEIKDGIGELKFLHKDVLQIHPAYQREAMMRKVIEIASCWSWVGAGAIVVGERTGEFWVIDGQHRVLAAKRRSDITQLPCVVFKTEGIKQEAIAFLDLNAGRKPVTSIGKFKAMIAAGDEHACAVKNILDAYGVSIKKTAFKPGEFKAVSWAIKRAKEDVDKFDLIVSVALELSTDIYLQEMLLDGLWYINENVPNGISDKRLYDRLLAIGARRLIESAKKASAYFVKGGSKVWAIGMIEEVNKGLRNKFSLRED